MFGNGRERDEGEHRDNRTPEDDHGELRQ